MRRRTFIAGAGAMGFAVGARAIRAGAAEVAAAPQKPPFPPQPDLIPAPRDPAEWPAFRERLAAWRAEARQALAYSDALYRRSDFGWVASCFSCCFLMLCDEFFYDRASGRYTARQFFDHGAAEFGGYDAVVFWHAYPRIGIDDRNQFDFYRDMPGGLPGLRRVVDALHGRGVKVFIDYNPWDRGTRREAVSDLDALVEIVGAIAADGIFLDTMAQGAGEFRAKLDAARDGVVLEGEGALPLDRIHDHHMSWAQGFADSDAPGILRNKWFERRHLQHQIHRWNPDHSAELQAAWMNGSGMMVWENVFGTWIGWNGRDRSTLRSMLPIQRRYARIFAGEGWTPLVPAEAPGVFASLWKGEGLRLWTLVNRSKEDASGVLLHVEAGERDRFFDLIEGVPVRPEPASAAGTLALAGHIPARGIGCFLARGADAADAADFDFFLDDQRSLRGRASVSVEFPVRRTVLKRVPRTARRAAGQVPPGMARIPAATFRMKVEFRTRECGFYDSQSPHLVGAGWHPLHGPAHFERDVALAPFAIDLTPVTNRQYAEFLEATGYENPRHGENFLKHWKEGRPPLGAEEHPVVYVDLDDARAYAAWAGKRLPTEEEWQYAAQGPEALVYPWGNEFDPARCNGGERGGTTPVTAFPAGRSPFGLYDMCGNVWEWTESERSDGRTRFCIIKGGSYYQAKGSDWYMDGGPRPCRFAVKFLLAWPGLDRCATIGFRCVADLA